MKVVINGAGAVGMSVCCLLLSAGFKDITLCDRPGIICEDHTEGLNPYMADMGKVTNREHKRGRRRWPIWWGMTCLPTISFSLPLAPAWRIRWLPQSSRLPAIPAWRGFEFFKIQKPS